MNLQRVLGGGGAPYIQLCAPKVVAMAVRMVMRMLRIFPQVELLLKVPIVLVSFEG